MTDVPTGWTPWHDSKASSRLRIYCYPHAGGSASTYLPWARSGGDEEFEFVPVELPGRGTRRHEAPATVMSVLAKDFVDYLAGRAATDRFVLFGHSLGAQIGYEVARQLEMNGLAPPVSLIVSSAFPPGSPNPYRIRDFSDHGLLEIMAALGGTPERLLADRALQRLVLPVLRADLTLLSRFLEQAVPYRLSCPIAAFGGAEDTVVGTHNLDSWLELSTSPHRRTQTFSGGHFFVSEQGELVRAAITAHLRDCLR